MKRTGIIKSISIMILISLVFTSLPVFASEASGRTISEELQNVMAETAPGDTIPVYIWYADVDHTKTERDAAKALGYTKEEIVEKAADSLTEAEKEALEVRGTASVFTADEVNEYLALTKTLRNTEALYTNQYIAEKRAQERTAYAEAATAFKANAGLSNEQIRFQSRYAPMMIAELTTSKIEDISRKKLPVSIDFCEEMEAVNCSTLTDWETVKNITGIEKIYSDIQLSGAGVKVGMVEEENVYLSSALPQYPSSRFHIVGYPYCITLDDTTNHANNTAKIMCSNYGVAYEADCYSVSLKRGAYTNFIYPDGFYAAIELLIDNNVTVINCSFGYVSHICPYAGSDKWVDHISHAHHVSFVASAGNNEKENTSQYSYLISPAKGFNVITVGGYDTLLTESTNDDIMYENSCYNSNGGCAKPDVIAPEDMFGGGTSRSAPFISGVVALMIEARPSLAIYPELIKAILLASCHRKVLPANNGLTETMYQGLTEVQGAGVADPFTAVCIICNGNFGMRTMSSNTSNSSIKLVQPAYDSTGLNFSIAWPRVNTISNSNHVSGYVTCGYVENLDITIKNGNSTVGHRFSNNQSTQMVYITPSSTNYNYTIEVDWVSNGSESIRYAYAWSLNRERYQHTQPFEGLYYPEYQNSGKYLNLNPSTLAVTQETFTGGVNQMWLVKKGAALKYFLGSANTAAKYYLTANTSATGPNYPATVTTTQQYNDYVLFRDEGSFQFRRSISGVNHALSINNGSLQSGAQAVWPNYSSTESSQRWNLCKCAYQRADVNMDGHITAADARLILRYATNLETPTLVQSFLADCNGDGSITSADSRIAERISVGLE